MSLLGTQNIYSMVPQLALNRASYGLSQSIEKLSSGLEINSSFDNPSGYSISEKMRGYIVGLKTAGENAQNGMSMLQTAEGAATQITDILGRMRELAVQGANGTYTAGDLAEIQKEMDQLKEEIDRISDTTEYNTIKLLNGDTAGELNSSTDKIEAIVTGTVETGNYDILVDSDPGTNEIQKSQIFSIREGSIGATIATAGTTNAFSVSEPQGFSPDEDVTITVGDSNGSFDNVNINSIYKQDESAFNITPFTAVTSNESGYYLVEFTETTGDEGITDATEVRVKFYSAEKGDEGAWVETTVGALVATAGYTYQSNSYEVNVRLDITVGEPFTATTGDKILLNVTDNKNITAVGTLAISGGGTLQLDNGPVVYFDEANSLTKSNNKDGIVDTHATVLHSFTLNEDNGAVEYSNITLNMEEYTPESAIATLSETLTGVITVEIRGAGEAVTATTKLSDVDAFYDSNGIFMFQSTQELRIYSNDGYTDIYLEGDDTFAEVEAKLNDALVKDLGLGSGNTAVDKQLVQFIENSSPEVGISATAGNFIVQTAVPGEPGEISFIGSQDVLDALGFSVVQESTNSITRVTAKDSETGVVVGELLTASSRVGDLIEGLDVIIDPRIGVHSTYNEFTGKLEFEKSERLEDKNITLHVVDDRTEIQVGTEQGEKIDITIPRLDTTALGINKTVIATQEDAQNAITEIDDAMAIVISVRGEIGAKVNRMEVASSILEESRTNITAAESRIRDLDIAEETTRYTSEQVKYQASMAVLAQANQIPQMTLELLRG